MIKAYEEYAGKVWKKTVTKNPEGSFGSSLAV